eukprot:scaffold84461_cov44-Prasinocladus_malaysianus.AAC.3
MILATAYTCSASGFATLTGTGPNLTFSGLWFAMSDEQPAVPPRPGRPAGPGRQPGGPQGGPQEPPARPRRRGLRCAGLRPVRRAMDHPQDQDRQLQRLGGLLPAGRQRHGGHPVHRPAVCVPRGGHPAQGGRGGRHPGPAGDGLGGRQGDQVEHADTHRGWVCAELGRDVQRPRQAHLGGVFPAGEPPPGAHLAVHHRAGGPHHRLAGELQRGRGDPHAAHPRQRGPGHGAAQALPDGARHHRLLAVLLLAGVNPAQRHRLLHGVSQGVGDGEDGGVRGRLWGPAHLGVFPHAG